MSIKYKFFALSIIMALILVVVSLIGYHNASTGLETNIESELEATVQEQALWQDAWIREKISYAQGAAQLMQMMDEQTSTADMQRILRLAEGDKDIVHLLNANESGTFVSSDTGDDTGRINPNSRPWYQLAKSARKLTITEPYVSAISGKLIRSIVAPYNDSKGDFRGAVCVPVEISTLQKHVKEITYHGKGESILIDPKGVVIASTNEDENMTPIQNHPILAAHFEAMKDTKQGYFTLTSTKGEELFAYATIPTTGAFMGILVPEREVFGSLTRLRIVYASLTLLGFGLSLFLSLKLCMEIMRRIESMRLAAEVMAAGDLHLPDLDDNRKDEIDDLSRAFNTMKNHLKSLVQKISSSSAQVAASSEELTATTQQSAETSTSVTSSMVNIASGLRHTSEHMGNMVHEAERISQGINSVVTKTNLTTDFSQKTAADAKRGAALMQQALVSMERMEKVAGDTTKVVQKLGESSQRIGEIVETISMIAKQTNLLSLNAAIEAARAGEAGKGFAVVADEVRKLAEQSQQSAEEISDRIAVIQNDTQEAVNAIEAGAENINQGTGAIRDVGTQFDGILQKVASIHEQVHDIDDTVGTLNQATQRIVLGMESIDQITKEAAAQVQSVSAATEEQNASAEEIASFSKGLAKMAVDMQTETQRFKL